MAQRTTSTILPVVGDEMQDDFALAMSVDSAVVYSDAPSSATQARTLLPSEHGVSSVATQEVALLREQLAREKAAHALQRSNAIQARRVADCLRACHTSLLNHLQQPCFHLDRDGRISHWNPAMADWMGLAAAEIEGGSLAACFLPQTCALIEEAIRLSLASAATRVETAPVLTLQGPLCLRADRTAAELSLIPLYRIPGVIEAFLLLFSR